MRFSWKDVFGFLIIASSTTLFFLGVFSDECPDAITYLSAVSTVACFVQFLFWAFSWGRDPDDKMMTLLLASVCLFTFPASVAVLMNEYRKVLFLIAAFSASVFFAAQMLIVHNMINPYGTERKTGSKMKMSGFYAWLVGQLVLLIVTVSIASAEYKKTPVAVFALAWTCLGLYILLALAFRIKRYRAVYTGGISVVLYYCLSAHTMLVLRKPESEYQRATSIVTFGVFYLFLLISHAGMGDL